jgi:hypothetical protein
MKISISVRSGMRAATAWCDVPEEHEGLPQAELLDRYIAPSFAAALDRLNNPPVNA